MTALPTDPRLMHFRHQWGRPHLILACHAAFPLALTPDLLYRLWAHFRCDSHGQPLDIPWVAVADVLLAPFCQAVGYDLYEIDPEVRTTLLQQLRTDPQFGAQRLRALAEFMLSYHPLTQLSSHDPDLRDLAQVQRWMALAHTHPTQVVHDLAQTLGQISDPTGAEWGRMAALIPRLHLPAGEARSLEHYALGMAYLSQGNPQAARAHLGRLPGGGRRRVTIAGVPLTLPPDLGDQPSRGMTRRRWLQWAGWGTVGVVGTAVLHRVATSNSRVGSEQGSLSLQAVSFPIEVVTVTPQGQAATRQSLTVQGSRWSQGDRFVLEVVNIPAGEFDMGSPDSEAERSDDEGPQHRVQVAAFSMGRYPVTQAQWRFGASLPQVNRQLPPEPSSFKGDDRPVERVTWEQAVEFCDRISVFLDTPCRLPSEAEWEYACRAGTTTPFHFGETITPDLANYDGSVVYGQGPTGTVRGETTPVGSLGVANAWGLYDMHGNVWEWCQDHWHSNYEGAPTDGSAWLDVEVEENKSRVRRGGSWNLFPRYCRSAYRSYDFPRGSDFFLGFRLVLVAPRALA